VDLVPDAWFDKGGPPAAEARDMYLRFLQIRLGASEIFIKEAQNARATLV
jgi:hypothetical protein